MNNVLYALFRRLRVPLITMILVYAGSILGFVLIPGMDDQGNVYRMDFFHAVYFVSFMGSTIGFGEIPYAFTDAQRMWTLATIYATVIAWLYGIGTILALVQEPVFGRMLRRRSFVRKVDNMTEPFYLVCGYGVTGSIIVRKLAKRGIRSVVVDLDEGRVDAVETTGELQFEVPGLCADASLPDVLDDAGLQHDKCVGVLALTNVDQVNLSIAIASKLLRPERMVISRTEEDVTTANLLSFGTDQVVNPFRVYAEYLSLAAHAPYTHLVYDWLVNPYHRPLSSAYQKTKGRWIICGYGRFGSALYREFDEDDVDLTVVDSNLSLDTDLPYMVRGKGTEALTLSEAGVEDAVGIIAGTANDADNLSIIMTAREMNKKLITVVRQNVHANKLVFKNSKADFVMEPGQIIANRVLAHLKSPLLPVFIEQMQAYDDVWAHTLLNRMNSVAKEEELDSWSVKVDEENSPALMESLNSGGDVTLGILLKDPRDRQQKLSAFPLMLHSGDMYDILPGELDLLKPGDEILFCGKSKSLRRMEWTMNNFNTLHYLQTGHEPTGNLLSRLLSRQ
ncbi:NAD-binding protein [Pontibacterium sp. N1Y112]|uniref:NAD-binding protein n=1 Tax=Pontibacterium sinense TaxID=2781979 RepID=A0A8J7FAS8_9GAMM|nr:NAD-binding protein [Pontibacterium sinense]MBE9396622.1 NAD-binding protein [Pontibacterium sinense]